MERLLTLSKAGLTLAALLSVGLAAPATAHDRDVSIDLFGDHQGRITVVTVDDDGNRHEESFEFDADHPPGYLGIAFEDDEDGIRISQVFDDSPAQRAGLEPGDVIVRFDGNVIDSRIGLMKNVWASEPGDRVEIEVLRDGRNEKFEVELGERKGLDPEQRIRLREQMGHLREQMGDLRERLRGMRGLERDLRFPGRYGHLLGARPRLGVELVDTTPELREHLGGDPDRGVLVGRVMAGMPAAESGVEVGDLIVNVDGTDIEDVGDLRRALVEGEGRTIDVEVIREGRSVDVEIYLPDAEERKTKGPQA